MLTMYLEKIMSYSSWKLSKTSLMMKPGSEDIVISLAGFEVREFGFGKSIPTENGKSTLFDSCAGLHKAFLAIYAM